MVNSADVKSLLMRLHGEMEKSPGQGEAGQASFAKSMDESLAGSLGASVAAMSATDARVARVAGAGLDAKSVPGAVAPAASFPAAGQKLEPRVAVVAGGGAGVGDASMIVGQVAAGESAPLVAAEPVVLEPDAADRVVTRPVLENVEELPRQVASTKEIAAGAAKTVEDAAVVVKAFGGSAVATKADESQSSSSLIKNRTGAAKGKAHKEHETAKPGAGGDLTIGSVAAAVEPKAVVVDASQQVGPSQQVDPTQRAVAVAAALPVASGPVSAEPVVAVTPGSDKSIGDGPVAARGGRVGGGAMRGSSVAPAVANAGVHEIRKGKEADAASVDGAPKGGVVAEHARVPDADEHAAVKAAGGAESAHAALGLSVAATPVHAASPTADHAAAQVAVSKEASASGLAQTAAEAGDHAAMEPRLVSTQEHRTLAATPSTLEVGVASGTHGWLKIRAELTDTGAVKAALSSTSAAGQEMLHRELPALTSFLDQERVAVSSLVVHQTSGSGLYAGADAGGGTVGQQAQGDHAGAGRQEQAGRFGGVEESVLPDALLDSQTGDLLATGGLSSGGGWLSVRA